MIQVGFSTRKRNPLSALIRLLTGSKVSHVWLLIDESFFGIELVLESTEVGFRLIPFESFKTDNDVVVVLALSPEYPLEAGIKAAAQWLGETYDFLGLLGTIFVIVGRWFKRKWKNPIHSSKSMFCSQAVVRFLQAASYPGTVDMDPEATTPQDLLNFLTLPSEPAGG